MPVLYALGNSDNSAGLHLDRRFAPLLIPAATINTDEHLHRLVMNVPVVAACRLKCHIDRASIVGIQRSDITVADKVLCIISIEVATGPSAISGTTVSHILTIDGGNRLAGTPSLGASHMSGKHLWNGMQFLVGDTHIAGTTHVSHQLRFTTLQRRDGTDGHDLTLGLAKDVAGKDVTKQVSLEVIVGLRSEVIVKGLARESRLYFGTSLEGVIVLRQRRCIGAYHSGLALLFTVSNNTLQDP